MISGRFLYALTVGMVVTVNPCGFAMLPAYLSSFLGISGRNAEREAGTADATGRALVVSGSVTAGFLSVFLILGTLARAGATFVYSASKWFTMLIGLGLVVLGIAMVFGYKPPILTPKLEKGGRSRTIGSMFLFGVSYAVASLGCSIAPFLGVVFTGRRTLGVVSGAALFLAYGLGFGLVLTTLTVSLALAQGGFLKALRRTMQFVDRASAVLLILAGLYVAWYGLSEIRGTAAKDGVTGRGTQWAARVLTFIQDNRSWIIGLAAVVIGGAIANIVLRRRRTPSAS
jgi:cytochrome c-type biogenesis protein